MELEIELAEYLRLSAAAEQARKAVDAKAREIAANLPAHGVAETVVANQPYCVTRFGNTIHVRRKRPIADKDAVQATDQTGSLDKMTKAQLLDRAAEMGVRVDESMKKADIIASIHPETDE